MMSSLQQDRSVTVVDLTLPITDTPQEPRRLTRSERRLRFGRDEYTAVVHRLAYGSMAGTYIDFPGHIKETDDGADAENYPVDRLLRVRTAVIRLDRESGSGGVTADELASASPDTTGCGGIVINALGSRRFDEIANRSVWLTPDAARWIIDTGAHLLVSDIYEREPELTGIFRDFFAAGIAAVCCAINLHRLRAPHVRLTALPLRFSGAAQLPCRIAAEFTGE